MDKHEHGRPEQTGHPRDLATQQAANPCHDEVWVGDAARPLIRNVSPSEFPSCLRTWNGGPLELEDGHTHYGFVRHGQAVLRVSGHDYPILPEMYFAIPGGGSVRGHGEALLASRRAYLGFFHVGGPVEQFGRLRYINGCSDSVLIGPLTHGAPCLNLLYVPRDTRQTPHTHPSFRFGLVVSGAGQCFSGEQSHPLHVGSVFYIPQHELHHFVTEDSSLRIVAWHPDSDFGPTDENHPMLNRTAPAAAPQAASDGHQR